MSAFDRRPLNVRVVVEPTGDWAECDNSKATQDATARQLMRDARDHHGAGRPTASFIVDGVLARGDVSRAEL